MIRGFILLVNLVVSVAFASDAGQQIYLHGKDLDGNPITASVNGMESSSPLACVNCHRESGLGTSESGKTIPPVSWRFLAGDQQRTVDSQYQGLLAPRPVYDARLLHQILTTGVDFGGNSIDSWMPRYQISESQTEQLIEYLKRLYPADDPGINEDSISIATIVDPRIEPHVREQHIQFLSGLFGLKNSPTRRELKRKKFAPVYKAPQFEAYREWELSVWELPQDPEQWEQKLNQYYRQQPAFVVLAPMVKDNYAAVQRFCGAQQLPCLFAQGNGEFGGDYYNYVFQDRLKQRGDYLTRAMRKHGDRMLVLDDDGAIHKPQPDQSMISSVNPAALAALRENHKEYCNLEGILLLGVGIEAAEEIYRLECPGDQRLKITLIGDESVDYESIARLTRDNPQTSICWATDLDKVLRRNTREIRLKGLVHKFGLTDYIGEKLAMDLFAFGILSDSMSQLAGKFSRKYLLENIEHMLNSYPNLTYFSSLSGAPYQRAIVGPYRDFCAQDRPA